MAFRADAACYKDPGGWSSGLCVPPSGLAGRIQGGPDLACRLEFEAPYSGPPGYRLMVQLVTESHPSAHVLRCSTFHLDVENLTHQVASVMGQRLLDLSVSLTS